MGENHSTPIVHGIDRQGLNFVVDVAHAAHLFDRNVAGRADHEAGAGANGVQADLGRNLGAILAHAVQVAPIRKEVQNYMLSPFGQHEFFGVDLQ